MYYKLCLKSSDILHLVLEIFAFDGKIELKTSLSIPNAQKVADNFLLF